MLFWFAYDYCLYLIIVSHSIMISIFSHSRSFGPCSPWKILTLFCFPSARSSLPFCNFAIVSYNWLSLHRCFYMKLLYYFILFPSLPWTPLSSTLLFNIRNFYAIGNAICMGNSWTAILVMVCTLSLAPFS